MSLMRSQSLKNKEKYIKIKLKKKLQQLLSHYQSQKSIIADLLQNILPDPKTMTVSRLLFVDLTSLLFRETQQNSL